MYQEDATIFFNYVTRAGGRFMFEKKFQKFFLVM